MRIAFTGTRDGLTDAQRDAVATWLRDNVIEGSVLRHGACVGADAEFVLLIESLPRHRRDSVTIIAHPSNLPRMTDTASILSSDLCEGAKPPLERNRDMVDASLVLLACPKGNVEEQRSGTWASIRYARKVGRKVVVIWPYGTLG